MSDLQKLRHARLDHSRRNIGQPVAVFLAVLLAYVGTIAAVLASPLPVALVLSLLCGILVVMLFVIGHDACHQSFTSVAWLNHLIGRIAFLPTLHVYSLWDYEHNRRHHRYNNIRTLDYAWIPLSPDEFAARGVFGRAWYRFYRSPLGVPFYYLFELWAQRAIVPRRSLLGTVTWRDVADAAIMWAGVAVWAVVIVAAGNWFGKGAPMSLALGLLIPFLVFSAGLSLAIFLHHTHYTVRWYRTIEEWQHDNGAIHGTVHVEFPWIVRRVILNIMEHTAHHYAPGVPHYRLAAMQEEVAHAGGFKWKWSLRGYIRVCDRCKLFDYDRARWMNFRGETTSLSLRDDTAANDEPRGAPINASA